MKVFFYGLFMSEKLLRGQGLRPSNARLCSLHGYSLHIGDRAAVVRQEGALCYGYAMELTGSELEQLYSAPSVADYKPAQVTVQYNDGSTEQVVTYNLARSKAKGTNKAYAIKLIEVAASLGLPEAYVSDIKNRFAK